LLALFVRSLSVCSPFVVASSSPPFIFSFFCSSPPV
jgi:hypothetical protein